MKKLSLKVGVGLVLGLGVLAVGAPQAQAHPPCPPQNCGVPEGQFCNLPILLNTFGPAVFCQKCGGDCEGGKYFGTLRQYSCSGNTPPAPSEMWVLSTNGPSLGKCDD
jgi:hypothetical protein